MQDNSKVSRITKFIIEAGIIVVAIAIAWSTLKSSVGYNRIDIDRNTRSIEALSEDSRQVTGDIREIKVEQKYIRQGIEEIKKRIP